MLRCKVLLFPFSPRSNFDFIKVFHESEPINPLVFRVDIKRRAIRHCDRQRILVPAVVGGGSESLPAAFRQDDENGYGRGISFTSSITL